MREDHDKKHPKFYRKQTKTLLISLPDKK
jgi:hypothetical protein